MKITGVRTRPYVMKLSRPLGDANTPHGFDSSAGLAVFVDSDEGVTGVAPGAPGSDAAIAALSTLIVGRDPRGVRGLWQKMVNASFKGGNEGAANGAISSLDVALWDLKAKLNGEPLWKTLGASSRRVRAYASGIDMCLNDDDMAAFYRGKAAAGVSGGKLKVGIDLEADLRRTGVMKEALETSGKPAELMVDSNEYWSAKQAIRNISAFEEQFDLVWCEEPARRWDYRGLRKVSQSVKAAVATGENLNHVGDYMALMANEAVDVVQVGSGTSGITGALQVADMAYGFELPVSVMNSPGNHMAHLAAALPNHIMMEVIDAGFEAVLNADNHIEDGYHCPRRRARPRHRVRRGEVGADGGRPLRRQNQRGPHGPPPRRRAVFSAGRGAVGVGCGVGRAACERVHGGFANTVPARWSGQASQEVT